MKTFESQLYVPFGTKRQMSPVTNSAMDNLSIDLLNKTTTAHISKGGIEIQAEELLLATADDFEYHETSYRVLVPLCDNIQAEVTCKDSFGGNGWERIRNSVLENCMQYDSTVKLWNAARKTSTLFQNLPHTIFYGNEPSTANYFKMRRLEIPCTAKTARREYKKAVQKLKDDKASEDLLKWNFDSNRRSRLLKILRISSFITPRSAISSRCIDDHVRHSLKTELLRNIETNCNNLGLILVAEDYNFRNIIRKYQEPTEVNLPLSFTTCYKTSLYASKPTTLTPATMLDSEPLPGLLTKSTGVEFNFVIQNLVTAWVKKYDRLHDFTHQIPIKEVLPEGTNLNNITVKRSCSIWAKALRNETDAIPTKDDLNRMEWKGKRNFDTVTIDANILRTRKNAVR